FFSFYCQPCRLHLHSFPTRRSSDLTALPNSSFHCSKARKSCVLRENAAGKAVFSGFDPVQGKGTVLAETDASSIDAHGWSLSPEDRKSTRLNSSHRTISYAVVCLKK